MLKATAGSVMEMICLSVMHSFPCCCCYQNNCFQTEAEASTRIEMSQDWERPVTAVIIGAGNRGSVYASYALDYPKRLQIVGVATPTKNAKQHMRKWFGLSEERIYSCWSEVAAVEKFADCAIIATQDQLHRAPAVALAGKGYHLLLEKPMAVSAKDCQDIVKACHEAGVLLAVCHVLRYFPPVRTIKEIIDSGAIGDVVSIQHNEHVGFWHFAHSFVRGNWRKTSESTFSLLSKCCHDMDLIFYWMGGKRCQQVASMGSLFHFRKENHPQGASDRCLSCPVEQKCLYSAKKIYLDPKPAGPRWPMSVVCDVEDLLPQEYQQKLEEEVRRGPYGRCVYACDNDVNDNQIVLLQFEDGSTASLTMVAHTQQLCQRSTRVWGSKGQLEWDGTENGPILLHDFLSGSRTEVTPRQVVPPHVRCRGHAGADHFLMHSFVEAVYKKDPSFIPTGGADSLTSHLLVFAAQDALTQNKVANMNPDLTWTLS